MFANEGGLSSRSGIKRFDESVAYEVFRQ
jgi:hypothetical protein